MGGSTKIAVMWRGDWRSPDAPTHYEARLRPVMEALRAAHFKAAPIVFLEERAEAAREALRDCAGALVWINPLADGRDRTVVDALLREAAGRGTWVSAHPDVIAKMGVKDVLFTTRALGWGSDTDRYDDLADFRARFPAKVDAGPRVLKPHRGNDGQGVMKVAARGGAFSVQFASDDRVDGLSWEGLVEQVTPAFANGGRLIDQEFHAAGQGMVRCYLSFDRVIGFARQAPRADGGRPAFAMNSAKTMFASDEPAFGNLRESMHKDWIPAAKALLGLETAMLPALWDADFLVRGRASAGRSAFALCEINVSCVSPFPDAAPIEIANAVRRWAGA
ncbi:MAG: Cj0069 family protein [Proteobacteria bacterium]|nr:Cj0069 family protein [Pseudomonadota bacterium]